MRLIIMGQQAFGKECLEAVLKKGEDQVVAVYCAPDKEGKPVDPIKEFALEQGLPVVQPPNFKDQEVLDEMRGFNSGLCVMAYVTLFVPAAARDIPTLRLHLFPSVTPAQASRPKLHQLGAHRWCDQDRADLLLGE